MYFIDHGRQIMYFVYGVALFFLCECLRGKSTLNCRREEKSMAKGMPLRHRHPAGEPPMAVTHIDLFSVINHELMIKSVVNCDT